MHDQPNRFCRLNLVCCVEHSSWMREYNLHDLNEAKQGLNKLDKEISGSLLAMEDIEFLFGWCK